MFVITADQVGSRKGPDIVAAALDTLNRRYRSRLELPVDRNAGDEIQALTADAAAALDLVLELTRDGVWSVGLGCGSIRTPLPAETREASGDAFIAAREAVTRAKRAPTRFAAHALVAPRAADDAAAVLALLLTLREGRSPAGWELYDLVSTGLTQAEAGARLGITPQSASDRARAAGLRTELAAIGPLTRLLESLDDAQLNQGA
ncbi:DNA-binding protein [Leifsonia poae]|uniref:DNA-binding protein n=1 Tax=Leifsonia poae TaxID=110933 RepID=UPI001CBAA1A5|nr:DNA-binding protein [Leifsonia poae]